MQAIQVRQFGEPEVMQLAEIPTPVPAAGELLVEIRAAGVNPVDCYIRTGTYAVKPPLPYTPGLDGAGVVSAVGAGVKRFRPGMRVYVSRCLTGTYAAAVLCREEQAHPLPDAIGFEQGAAIGVPGAAAWRALFQRGAGRSGEKVLVRGASGSCGMAAVQLAKAAGMEVYGTAGGEEGCSLVMAAGAAGVCDHRRPEQAGQLAKFGGAGFDLIVEMLANVNLESDLALLAPRGRVVVVGSRGRIEIDPRATMGKETDIRGMALFNASSSELAEIHAGLGGRLADGSYQPVVSRSLPLVEAPTAHRLVLQDGNRGKIVLIP